MPDSVCDQDIDDDTGCDCDEEIVAVYHYPVMSMRRSAQVVMVPMVDYMMVMVILLGKRGASVEPACRVHLSGSVIAIVFLTDMRP